MNLTDNAILINNSTLAEILPLIRTGFANGKWNGTGIISSSANSIHAARGFSAPEQSFLRLNPGKMFEGNPVASTDVLIKYTLDGDTNSDGIVDANDYLNIDNGFNQQSTNSDWSAGDFNYDGVINGSDYTLIDNAFNSQELAGKLRRASQPK